MEVTVITNSLFTSTTNLILSDENHCKEAWIVDCGDTDVLIPHLKSNGYTLKGIFLTHGHFDHIYGINSIILAFPEVIIYTNSYGKMMLTDARKNMSHYWGQPITIHSEGHVTEVLDGDNIRLSDKIVAKPIFTPGHNPSCITWIIGDCIFTGDSYIPGIKIVTNLPGGNKLQSQKSLNLILQLAEGRTIYPGHQV